MTLQASLSASLSTVLNGKSNQLTPVECPSCAALRPGEGPRVLHVNDRDEGLGVTFPSGQESQSFWRSLS